jgi:hypothetical protein
MYSLDETELLTMSSLMAFARDPLSQCAVFPFLGIRRLSKRFR